MSWVKIFNNTSGSFNNLKDRVPTSLKIGSLELGIVRIDDEIKVFDKKCPHNKAILTDGKCTKFGDIVCPWHGYRFSLIDGREGEGRPYQLFIYPLKWENSTLYVRLKD